MLCSPSLAVYGRLQTSTGAAATRLTMTIEADRSAKALPNMDTDDIKVCACWASLILYVLSLYGLRYQMSRNAARQALVPTSSLTSEHS